VIFWRFLAVLCAATLVSGCGKLTDQPASTDSGDADQSVAVDPTSETPQDQDSQLALNQQRTSAKQPQRRGKQSGDAPKARLLRGLWDAFKDTDDGTKEERDLVSQIIRDSDSELSKVLGENSKNAILEANKRRPSRITFSHNRALKKPEKDSSDDPFADPLEDSGDSQ